MSGPVHGSLLSFILSFITPLTVRASLFPCYLSAGTAEMCCNWTLRDTILHTYISFQWISVCVIVYSIMENVNSDIVLFVISPSSYTSSLLLPAAPRPGGCCWSVRHPALCHCGLPGNGTVDQRWPCTGWRERPTRYSHWPLIPPSFLHCLLCLYCSLCLCRPCRDQCQVSLETKSLSVNG